MGLNSGSFLVFWIIRIAVFISFIITGYWISYDKKSKHSYWKGVTPLIIIYSLAEGLRWNRGTDYFSNYIELTTGSGMSDLTEPLYSLWLSTFHNMSIPFWVAFVFYSFVLIISFLCLIKRFPKIASVALPMLFLVSSMQSENLIRQFFALSFIIFALVSYFDKRYLLMVCLIIISEGIHFSALAPVLFIFISVLLANYYAPRKPIIPLFLFVLVYFFWDTSYFSTVMDPILRLMPETDTKMDAYVQSATWFTEEGSLSLLSGTTYTGRSLAKTIVQLPTYIFLVIGGFYATKTTPYLRICYWCAYIAILIDITRADIQAYLRFFHWIAFMIPLVVGTIYSELHLKKAIKILSILFLLVYYVWGLMFSNLFVIDPYGYDFIWDK